MQFLICALGFLYRSPTQYSKNYDYENSCFVTRWAAASHGPRPLGGALRLAPKHAGVVLRLAVVDVGLVDVGLVEVEGLAAIDVEVLEVQLVFSIDHRDVCANDSPTTCARAEQAHMAGGGLRKGREYPLAEVCPLDSPMRNRHQAGLS